MMKTVAATLAKADSSLRLIGAATRIKVGLTVRVFVNGEAMRLQAQTLQDVVMALGHGEAKVATAVNGAFVPESQRGNHAIADDDKVEIVSPRQGG